MRLGTRGRYAVTAMVDLALHGTERMVSLSAIAERQRISLPYLEQLFFSLRRAGLVSSARGPGGGYRLSRPAHEIVVSEILHAVDESLSAMGCEGEFGERCGKLPERCLTHDLWERLSSVVYVFLQGVSLADVAKRRIPACPALPGILVSADSGDGDPARPQP